MDKSKIPDDQKVLIGRIADRTAAIAHRYGVPYDRTTAEADLTAVHAGNELDLQAMLDASDDELSGDVFTIRRTIDRDTGQLRGDFKPHFTAKARADASPPTDAAPAGEKDRRDRQQGVAHSLVEPAAESRADALPPLGADDVTADKQQQQ
jgi:hypothetical protein